ncbi:MAG: hypothetical protein GY865_11460 [candidate division Zixibacteria bacterium]|nr:hypothetical protein [candidate division Zixibacteria bacterium]
MKTKIILFGLMAILGLFSLLITGCFDDEKEKTALPDDTADQTLMDTTITDKEPPADKPKEEKKKEVTEKPKPKPEPVQETKPVIIKTTILPENTPMEVTFLTQVSTTENQIGDKFRVMVKGPADKGQTLDLPAGVILEGIIADLNDGTAKKEKASIKLKFTDFILPGEKAIPIEGYITTDDSTGVVIAGGQAGTIAKDAGLGAIAGGLLGAITGKKEKKTGTAVKGAAAGAVVGGIAGALLHKDRVVFKEKADINITILSPVIQTTVK